MSVAACGLGNSLCCPTPLPDHTSIGSVLSVSALVPQALPPREAAALASLPTVVALRSLGERELSLALTLNNVELPAVMWALRSIEVGTDYKEGMAYDHQPQSPTADRDQHDHSHWHDMAPDHHEISDWKPGHSYVRVQAKYKRTEKALSALFTDIPHLLFAVLALGGTPPPEDQVRFREDLLLLVR